MLATQRIACGRCGRVARTTFRGRGQAISPDPQTLIQASLEDFIRGLGITREMGDLKRILKSAADVSPGGRTGGAIAVLEQVASLYFSHQRLLCWRSLGCAGSVVESFECG